MFTFHFRQYWPPSAPPPSIPIPPQYPPPKVILFVIALLCDMFDPQVLNGHTKMISIIHIGCP